MAPLRLRNRAQGNRLTEIYRGGIQSVGRFLEGHTDIVLGVELPRAANEALGEIRVDPPVSAAVGIGQRALGDPASKAGVIESGLQGIQADRDIAQALAVGQLGEGHAKELIAAREVADPIVASVMLDALVELASGEEVHQL